MLTSLKRFFSELVGVESALGVTTLSESILPSTKSLTCFRCLSDICFYGYFILLLELIYISEIVNARRMHTQLCGGCTVGSERVRARIFWYHNIYWEDNMFIITCLTFAICSVDEIIYPSFYLISTVNSDHIVTCQKMPLAEKTVKQKRYCIKKTF